MNHVLEANSQIVGGTQTPLGRVHLGDKEEKENDKVDVLPGEVEEQNQTKELIHVVDVSADGAVAASPSRQNRHSLNGFTQSKLPIHRK